MNGSKIAKTLCTICGKEFRIDQCTPSELIRPSVVEVIKAEKTDWIQEGYVCQEDVDRFRAEYVEQLLEDEKGALTKEEKEVVESIKDQEIISVDTNQEVEESMTLGERTADLIALFGGSWSFILFFGVTLFAYIALNTWFLTTQAFDPFPFIFLNMLLSVVAALQAPIIMMSQNRQSSRDRIQADAQYKLNLKSELEIRQIAQRMDFLIDQQWRKMLELQRVVLDSINDHKGR